MKATEARSARVTRRVKPTVELKTTWYIHQSLDEDTRRKIKPAFYRRNPIARKVVMQDPSEDLSESKGLREMLIVMQDGVLGHEHLYKNFAVIHGDMTAKNVRVMGKDKGALWDYDTTDKIIDPKQYVKIMCEEGKAGMIQELTERNEFIDSTTSSQNTDKLTALVIASKNKIASATELEQMLSDLRDAEGWEDLMDFGKRLDALRDMLSK